MGPYSKGGAGKGARRERERSERGGAIHLCGAEMTMMAGGGQDLDR